MSRTPGAKDKRPRSVKPTGEARGVTRDVGEDLPEGYNSRRVRFMMEIIPKEPLDHNDVAEMERRFANYLSLCEQYDMKIGNQAAYLAIGIDKGTVWDWLNRRTANPARADFVKKVQYICATAREGMMEDGKINPVVGIFWQKNYDGLKDQQEVVLTPNTSALGEQKTAEALREKYIEQTYGMLEKDAESAEGAETQIEKADPLPDGSATEE